MLYIYIIRAIWHEGAPCYNREPPQVRTLLGSLLYSWCNGPVHRSASIFRCYITEALCLQSLKWPQNSACPSQNKRSSSSTALALLHTLTFVLRCKHREGEEKCNQNTAIQHSTSQCYKILCSKCMYRKWTDLLIFVLLKMLEDGMSAVLTPFFLCLQ